MPDSEVLVDGPVTVVVLTVAALDPGHAAIHRAAQGILPKGRAGAAEAVATEAAVEGAGREMLRRRLQPSPTV